MRAATDTKVLAGFLLCLYVVLFIFRGLETLRVDRTPRFDAQDYATMAYNVAHYGVFSLSLERPDKPPLPMMHRPPAYPFLLALGIWASPDVRALDMEAFFKDESQARLRPLRWMQLLLLQLAAFLAMWLTWELTRSLPHAFLTLGLVGLDKEIISMSGAFLSEGLACFLLTSLSLCLALAVRTLSRSLFGLSGVCLAALALTRPAYAYFGVFLLAFFCLLWLRRPAEREKVRAGILIFLVCFAVPVGAWMGRNVYHFQKARIANGAGVVLDIRSRLDLMTLRQYEASFLFWSNSWYLDEITPEYFDEEALAFLDETSPEGAYQQAYARSGGLAMEHGSADADSLQKAEAMSRILSHPWRHIAVTVPVALRGIYVHGIVLSVLLFACLLCAFVMVCLRRDAVAVAALLPSAFSFAFHAFLTQNIPRFSQPLIAMLWVSVVLVLSKLSAPQRGIHSQT